MKKGLKKLIIKHIAVGGIICIAGMLTFSNISNAQKLKAGVSAVNTSHRAAISSNDHWPQSQTQLGAVFDSSDYRQVRVYASVTAGETWTVRALFWNATTGEWCEDSDETNTLVGDKECYLVTTNHHNSVFFMVDTKSGSGASTITIYVQGSNE